MVVATVSVDETAPPLTKAELGLKEQVGAFLPVIDAQESFTVPVYPPPGVTVMVEVVVFPAVMEAGLSAVAPIE
jgi:hypothetical protein